MSSSVCSRFFLGHAVFLAVQIEALAEHHALHAGAAGDLRNGFQAGAGAARVFQGSGKHRLKGVVEQAVAGEDGLSHAVDHVVGGAAAPQRVVVHAGQVVVDERIGVDHLHGAGKVQRFLCAAEHIRGRQQHRRAQALAAGHDAVTHGVVYHDAAGQELFKARLHARRVFLERRHSSSPSSGSSPLSVSTRMRLSPSSSSFSSPLFQRHAALECLKGLLQGQGAVLEVAHQRFQFVHTRFKGEFIHPLPPPRHCRPRICTSMASPARKAPCFGDALAILQNHGVAAAHHALRVERRERAAGDEQAALHGVALLRQRHRQARGERGKRRFPPLDEHAARPRSAPGKRKAPASARGGAAARAKAPRSSGAKALRPTV